jgi:hypothetical protein
MENDVYKRWKSFGFLDGLTEEDGVALAERYEELGNYMLQNSDKLDEHVETLAFPALRRAFQGGLNERYSPRALCEKLKEANMEIAAKGGKQSFKGIDPEAEMCAIVAQYFTRDKNKKIKL